MNDSSVLEILKQGNQLAMSIFQQAELISTVKHYSQCPIEFTEINQLCQEVISILNKAHKKNSCDIELVNQLKRIGQLLWDHLLTKSVKERLRTTANRSLVLSLDEELINIPWELLYDGGNFLCLRFNLSRLIRTKTQTGIPQYRNHSDVLRMLILSNPTNDLKSAYKEGVYIRNQFDRNRKQIQIDFKSTYIDTLYIKKNLCDYDIVHFAGHCEYNKNNPSESGWILSNGRFTIKDIFALGESLSLPTLVFSNACHSAGVIVDLIDINYQQETYNLASAFLFSGVRIYIGTIWKVEDSASLIFAKEFYTYLIRGRSIGESVRLARLKLLREFGTDSIYWASYLVYGDPNFVLFRSRSRSPKINLKRKIRLYKKPLLRLSLAGVIIFICICLYLWLPTLNPNSYIMLIRSRKLFLEGKNKDVIAICSQIIKKDPLYLASYPLLSDAYHRLGKNDEALKYYFDYAFYSDKRHDKRGLVSAYIGIAWIYHQKGEYSKAYDFYLKALALSQENKDKLNQAIVLRKLALWHIDKRNYNEALESLIKASEINREKQNIYEYKYNLACDYFDLGLLFTNKDDLVTAKEFYDKSLKLFSSLKLKYELSDYYFNMGEIYKFEKHYQKAIQCYFKGLEIDEAMNNLSNLAGDYDMLGELYLEMGKLSEAERYFKRAIDISRQIDAPLELASACYNLGSLYKKKRDNIKAKDYLIQAQEIYKSVDLPDYQEIKKELTDLGE